MHTLKHSKEITESFAMNEIFNACRANESRKNVGNVSFKLFPTAYGSYWEATLRRFPGSKVLATAIVDEWDV